MKIKLGQLKRLVRETVSEVKLGISGISSFGDEYSKKDDENSRKNNDEDEVEYDVDVDFESEELDENLSRNKLVLMYKRLGQRLKKIGPNTSPSELDELKQEIQNIASIDMGLGERLMTFYQKKKKAAERAWSHVPNKTNPARNPYRRPKRFA